MVLDLSIPEGVEVEYKKATDTLPRSFWETYSSFANTQGGIVILGVSEEGGLHAVGVNNAQKIIDDLWNIALNPQKVSSNILVDSDVEIIRSEGKDLIVVKIPEADRRLKPIYLNGNMTAGTFVRYGQGDHHCSRSRLNEMVRDSQDVPNDDAPLKEIPMKALNLGAVDRYRTMFASMNPKSSYNALPDIEFLQLLGAVDEIEGEKHPTKAGTLMFCNSLYIVKAYPHYFLDYREFDRGGADWTARISSMAPEKDDNLFDFYYTVSEKIWKALPEPLEFDDSLLSRSDTHLRRAVRELITNAIVHADYLGEMGVVIDKKPDSITISNPGLFRISIDDAVKGGRSNPRNPTLFRMFGLIGAIERAGTGVNRSISEIVSSDLDAPVIEQTYEPSRTIVTIGLRNTVKGSDDDEEKILKLMRDDWSISLDRLSAETGISRNKAYSIVKKLISEGKLAREGPSRGGRWKVLD